MKVKWFDTRVKAEWWARHFDYARGLLKLPPLKVVPDEGRWAVDNPDFKDSLPARLAPPGNRAPVNAKVERRTVKVPSNDPKKRKRGIKYTLIVEGHSAVACDCQGFYWKKTCSHVDKYNTTGGGR